MNSLQLALIAWRNLWRNPRRTLLTLCAITFGVFLAVLLTALNDRNFSDMIDVAARLGGGHVVIQHPEYIDTPNLTRTVSGTTALRAAAQADPDVSHAVDRISGQAMMSTASHNAGVMFIAYDPDNEDDTTLSFLEGITAGGLLPGGGANDKSVVLGHKLADNLHVELGDKVVYTLMDRSGEIVGGMARVGGLVGTGADSLDGGLALLPIARVREVLGYGPDEATQVALFLSDSRRSGEVAQRLHADLPPTASALTWDTVQPDLSGFIAMKVGGAVFMELVIMVLVAASIFNTLFVSVMERMREFGIMRAIGYSPRQIFGLVMWESLWLAIVGLVAGIALTAGPYWYLAKNGIDVSAAYGDEALDIAGVGFSPILNVGIFPDHAVIIGLVAMAATLTAGLYPAWRAGRVVPVDAIKLL